jgi:protein dithiol oxidoreductase (disulfide-forming)
MERILAVLLLTLALAPASGARAAESFAEGRNYVRVMPPQPTSGPAGTVEVMEVFSYGCPACNGFQPIMEQLRRALPPNARVVYLPASFNPGEDWPTFQRAYLTARLLGIADGTHQAMFDAIWKTGELSVSDPVTHRLRNPLPSLEDVARWYARAAGVSAATFVSTAQSFVIDMQVKATDAQIQAMEIPGTPCIVVNGKYRVLNESVHNTDEFIALVSFLVARESH